jgi:hypothetical protein
MFNILLVPLDGSPQSVHVIDLVSRVAAPGTATVHLLCVAFPMLVKGTGYEFRMEPLSIYRSCQDRASFSRCGVCLPKLCWQARSK